MSNIDPDVVAGPQKMPLVAKIIFGVLLFGVSLGFVYLTSVVMLSGFTVSFWEYVLVTIGGWALAGIIYGITYWADGRSGNGVVQ